MTGKLQTKSLSKVLADKTFWISVIEILLAIGFGALAITLHARLRIPLKLPGHHGLEFMALLILIKSISQQRFTGSFFSLGVGTMLFIPVLGFSDPFAPIVYMVPGLVLDIFFLLKPVLSRNIFFTGLVGGFAYATIPLIRIYISFMTGYIYKSMLSGPWFPLLMYFSFGFAGTIIVAGIIKSFKKNT